jgi:hypothetical protein
LDGLVDARIILDDHMGIITERDYRPGPEHVASGSGYVTVELWSLEHQQVEMSLP